MHAATVGLERSMTHQRDEEAQAICRGEPRIERLGDDGAVEEDAEQQLEGIDAIAKVILDGGPQLIDEVGFPLVADGTAEVGSRCIVVCDADMMECGIIEVIGGLLELDMNSHAGKIGTGEQHDEEQDASHDVVPLHERLADERHLPCGEGDHELLEHDEEEAEPQVLVRCDYVHGE